VRCTIELSTKEPARESYASGICGDRGSLSITSVLAAAH
jgi:hypothetical protein